MSSTEPLLRVRDVHAGYDDLSVLRGVDLDVGERSTTAVLGPNGAGKSTLIRSIAGSLQLTDGEVILEGVSQGDLPNHRWMQRIGWAPEGRMLFSDYSVRDNLRLSARAAGADDDFEAALEECIDLFPIIGDRLRQSAGHLSGGQQQMVAIARALVRRPRLLLLDEPSLGLAPLVLDSIRESLVQLRASGLSILIAEQNVPWLEDIVDEVIVLGEGRDIARGGPDLLKDRETVKRIYIGA